MDHPSLEDASAMSARLMKQSQRGGPKNLCPFGCQRLDERGYCRHLIGFSLNGKTMELRERMGRGFERTGHLIAAVEDEDVLKAATQDRINKALESCPSPTYRVYRKTGRAPIADDGKQITAPKMSEYATDDFIEDADLEPAAELLPTRR